MNVVVMERSPMGAVLFGAGSHRFYWNGVGATVRLFFGDALVTIDGLRGWAAMTEREAKEEVRFFLMLGRNNTLYDQNLPSNGVTA
jgi:hypothetical protein